MQPLEDQALDQVLSDYYMNSHSNTSQYSHGDNYWNPKLFYNWLVGFCELHHLESHPVSIEHFIQLSDRYGRTFIMGIAICGLLVQDLNFIIVTLFPSKVPGGHFFVLFGSVVEGCLGGMSMDHPS